MPDLRESLLACLLTAALCASVSAQKLNVSSQPSSVTITASAAGEHVRITAGAAVANLRVEVYSTDGQKVIDQEIRGGNVFDWHLQNGQGEVVPPGNYVCVVTTKAVSGRLSQKFGSLSIEEKSVNVRVLDSQELSPAQAQTIGPVEENSSWIVADKDEPQTATVIAHDGQDGQMIRGRGSLTFRIGNFFTGNDQEQMRLTEAGNLGIGTSSPKAKLDVAGTVRAERFLIARPKTTGSDTTTAGTTADAANIQPLIAGTGTQDRIAKWTDNAGTLGDSGIIEIASGLVGIGTSSPTVNLDVRKPGGNAPIRSVNETFGVRGVIAQQHSTNVVGAVFVGLKSRGTFAAPSAVVPGDFGGFFSNKWFDGSSYVQSGAFGVTVDGPVSPGVVPTRLSFITSSSSGDGPTAHGVERMTILSGGNVGIGTTTPVGRLNIAGSAGAIQGVQIDNREIKFRGDGDAHYSIFANRIPGTLTIEDTSVNQDMNTAGTVALAIAKGSGNVGIGITNPTTKFHVNGRVLFENGGNNGVRITPASDSDVGVLNVTNAANTINWLTVGNNGQVIMNNSGADPKVAITGNVKVTNGLYETNSVASGSSTVPTCWTTNFASAPYVLGLCSSSLRYKTKVQSFAGGLDLINLLHPITFTWKHGGVRDIGLGAEDVEQIEPLLTFRNTKGEIEGVRYDLVAVVLVNAVKQQQALIVDQRKQLQQEEEQIKRQGEQIKRQEEEATQQRAALVTQAQELKALKNLVCRFHRRATVCR